MSMQMNFGAQREFEAIEYPGKVVNTDRMIQTLGGIINISQVLSDEKKRLELRYHPENPYNKPLWGDSVVRTGVLLKVTVRRSKRDPSRAPKYFVRLIGHCDRVFVFNSLCDFQYLPLCNDANSEEPNKLQFVLDKIVPQNISELEYFNRPNVPLLCLPEIFARVDLVHAGVYRIDPKEHGQHDVLGLLQKHTYDHRDVVAFSMSDPFPTHPDPQIVKRMKVKYVSDEQFDRVKQLFNECPIWTRIALLYESGVLNEKLKCIIPSVAYYFSTGPWRTLYVRYGYDPRKDFNSRHYQTFDFRLRFGSGVSEFVYNHKTRMKNKREGVDELTALVQDIKYPYFDEHKLPRSRQCILRYCDVHMQRIQDMLEKIPSPLTGATCNERTGWLPIGFDGQVRQVVCNSIKELLRNHYRKENLNTEVEAVEANMDEDDDEVDVEESGDEEEIDSDQPTVSHKFLDKNLEGFLNNMEIDSDD